MKKLLKNKIIGLFLIGLFAVSPLFVNFAQAVSYPVPHIVTTSGITHANGNFLPIAQTVANAANSTEAYVQTYMTYSGTWSGFSLYFRTANASGDTTFTVRKNGVDTAMTITVPQNTTGFFQDLTNTVSVAVGDLVSIGVTTTAGTTTSVPSITTLFTADSGDSVQYAMMYEPGAFSFTATNRYFRPAGDCTAAITTEANAQNMIQHDATIEAIGVYVSANTRTQSTVFYNRINGADGNVSVSVASSATGLQFSDTSSDAVNAGDLINSRGAIASGSGSIGIRNVQYTIVSDNPREITFMGGNTLSRSSATGSAWNFAAGYTMNSGATEAVARSYPITPGVMSGLAYYVSANTATQTLTYQLRKNASDVGNVVAIATGVTGWVQDVTNSDAFTSTDYSTMNGSRSVAGSGSTTMQNTSMKYTMDLIADSFIPQINIF